MPCHGPGGRAERGTTAALILGESEQQDRGLVLPRPSKAYVDNPTGFAFAPRLKHAFRGLEGKRRTGHRAFIRRGYDETWAA